jgi:hypothetical protein
MLQLSPERGGETLLIRWLMADMAVEVAIRALCRAERPMQVDAEAGIGHSFAPARALER